LSPLPDDLPGAAALAETGAVLASGSLALAPIAVAVLRRVFAGRNVFFARWGFSHVAQVAALAGALVLLLSLAGARLEAVPLPRRTVVEMALRAGVLLACCGAVALFARRLDPSGLRCLGLWPGRNSRAALAGLAAYGMVLPGILGLGMLWPWVLRAAGVEIEAEPLAARLRDLAGADRAAAVLLGVLVAPLLEEILFRAFLQPLLVQNLSDRLGVVATSLVFAALHGIEALVPIFALSLLLGAIMLRTQRLFAVWVVHATHNALVFLLLYAR
jgi:membrane protease YdiL (CAAX protease family)